MKFCQDENIMQYGPDFILDINIQDLHMTENTVMGP